MKIVVSATHAEQAKKVAGDILESLRSKKHPLVCMASGDSPAGLYKELVNRVQDKNLDVSHWYFTGLDEWAGMNENDVGSCKYHLDRQFFHPLKIAEEKICFFNGRAHDAEKECERIETFIRDHGGIDVAVLGLGMNGHVGMNEPGTSPELRSHLAEIDPETQKTGQKYFPGPVSLSHGLTLGLANLMEAKKIVLIVNGAHKASIVQKLLEEEITIQRPASLLRNHPDLTVYLDEAAAKLLSTAHGK